ncbi:MAG: hypothetical protein B6A08_11430 [Sorangiineae bacterium NIC37A_2]|nr:MAG: hypothetical protein B6A08_11430 [Sorangiineae bacterium NIC37A_2]
MGDSSNGQARRQPPSPPRREAAAPAPFAQNGVASAPIASAPIASAPIASAPIASAPVASAPAFEAPKSQDAARSAKRDPDLVPLTREAHREFRKGTWTKPLLLGALAAGLLAALSLLSGEKAKEQPKTAARPLTAQPEPEFTIGSSQAPDRIPDVPVNQTSVRSRKKTEEPPERPSGIVPEKQFASEFKQRARQSEQ